MTLDGREMLMSNQYMYLCFIIQNDGKIDSDVNYKIQTVWLKCRSATGVLNNHIIHLYDMECWTETSSMKDKCSIDVYVLFGCVVTLKRWEMRILTKVGATSRVENARKLLTMVQSCARRPMNTSLWRGKYINVGQV